MPDFVPVASLSDLSDGEVLGLWRRRGDGSASPMWRGRSTPSPTTAPTATSPLSNGELDTDDCTITCEWHGAIFDIRSGAALGLPATRPIATYPTRVEDGQIFVDVSG